MAKIYVTGHRNPDLDTVCSAYAYAELKNKTDSKNEYIAVRCGHLGDSAKNILASLEITPPPYMRDVYPKVSDVMLTAAKKIEADEPLSVLAQDYSDRNPSVTPIYRNGEFEGLLSVDDITAWLMANIANGGTVGKTPAIEEVMRDQEQPLQVNDLFEEAKVSLSTSQKRGLSVFDGNEFKGFVTRRCFLKCPSYNVILMDHNEPRQSIKGIETANIVEIIDHHRLDSVRTALPIFIDAEPLGSTCTIVHRLYLRNNVEVSPYIAKVLLTGMMADTLILKSPTTTPSDVESAHALAEIIGVDIEEFGMNMFSHMTGLANVTPETAILSDFKKYTEKGASIGIGQCEVTTLHDVNEYKSAFLTALNDVRVKGGLDWAVVMITNVMNENSILLSTDFKAVKYLPYAKLEPGIFDMPGVMSRKKQLLPEMLSAIGMTS